MLMDFCECQWGLRPVILVSGQERAEAGPVFEDGVSFAVEPGLYNVLLRPMRPLGQWELGRTTKTYLQW